MNRPVLIATFVLLALAGLSAWRLRASMKDEKSHEQAVLSAKAQKKAQLPPPPIDAPQPVVAAQYFDVAQHTLFSKDRNPTEIVEVKPPPPKPPLPPLPSYYGQFRLGAPTVLLSTAGSPQKAYHQGDKVGDKDKYVIIGFDSEKITLGFNDETVEKKLEELRPKESERSAATSAASGSAAPGAAARPPASSSQSLSSLAPADSSEKKDDVIGAPYGAGYYACVAGDSTPDGAMHDGKRKVISQTLFGKSCHWETVK